MFNMTFVCPLVFEGRGQTEERGAGLTSDIPVWYGLDWWVLEMWTLVWWTLITGYSKQTIENQSTKLSLCYNKMVAAEWVCQCQFLLSPYNNRKWQFFWCVIISKLVTTNTDKVHYEVNSCILYRRLVLMSLGVLRWKKISLLFQSSVLSFINIARILFSILFCKKSTKHLYKKLNLILRNGKTKSN